MNSIPEPGDQVDDGTRDQDRSGRRECFDAFGDHDCDTVDVIASLFDLAGVHADAHLDTEAAYRIADRSRASQGPAWTVEGCEHPVTRRLDLTSAPTPEFGPHRRVVGTHELLPAPVTDPRRVFGRTDEVGEHHGCEHPVGRVRGELSGHEPLDRVEQRPAVTRVEQAVLTREPDGLGAVDVLGDVLADL